jgi:hypothetical protein
MPTQSQLDIYKELTYPLCQFLVDKRLSRSGKGRNNAIDIPIAEFEAMLGATFVNVPEHKAKKWELLKNELMLLADERDASGQNSLITIESADVLDALASEEGRTTAQVLRLRYSRVAMEDYVKYLKDGDEKISGNRNGLIAWPPIEKGKGLLWIFGDYGRIHIKPRGKASVRVRLCRLLYGMSIMADGEPTSIQSNEFDDYTEYQPGCAVSTDLLAKIMFPDEWQTGRLAHEDIIKTVEDAIIGLNERTREVFKREVYRLTEEKMVSLVD